MMSPESFSPLSMGTPSTAYSSPQAIVRTNEPYKWKCLPDDAMQAAIILAQRTAATAIKQQYQVQQAIVLALHAPNPLVAPISPSMLVGDFNNDKDEAPPTPTSPAVCRALVQFKCHQTEYSSPIMVEKGQYVVVQGDRGIDIGVVIRVNTDSHKSYVERTGPSGSILRHATQREVDYWATDLKADEATAVEFCQQRVIRHHLSMEVRHAEYQFDKKKLTFYYDAKARVDFVQLLKELYREYGCRIWMEKVRMHD